MADETIAGRYRLLEPLGRGAMSSVWLAEDEELARRVAVKMLAPNADRARFEREARVVASLSHPNIAGLYDYGEAGGRPYMVLEYLPGGTLEDRLRAGPLQDDETRGIAGGVAAGLAHAHARGLVHRDLKPANVLFDAEDRPKIADFGIARISGGGTLTEAGTVLGTASYISPEQASGEQAGPASDVYSFGAILFRMLTGRLPFVGTNAMELVRQHRDEPAPPVRSVRPDAPADLADLADAALAKRPASRPADGAALLAALTGAGAAAAATTILAPGAVASTGQTAAATQVLQPPAAPPARRRRATPALLVAALAVLLAGGAAAAWLATRPADAPAPAAPPPTVRLPTVTAGRTSTAPTTTAPLTTAPTTTAPPTTSTPLTTTKAATTTHPAPTTTHAAPTTTTAPPPVTTVAPPTVSVPPPPPVTTTLLPPTTTAAATTTAATTTVAAAPAATTTTTTTP